MKVTPSNTTMPQTRQQGQHQQPSKPRSTNEDFKKVFEDEIKKRYGDKVASKVVFL